MMLNRINSSLNTHFGVELEELKVTPLQKDGQAEGLYSLGPRTYFKPLGARPTYELKGEVRETQRRPLEAVLGLLLDSWVTEHHRKDLLDALEVQLLHQMFLGDKVIPLRQRKVDLGERFSLPAPPHRSPTRLKKTWQALLGESSDALFIGQEIHRLLGHQAFLRIIEPREWIAYLESDPGKLTQTTVVVELDKFPEKSFLVKESSQWLGENTFMLIQNSSAKKLLRLPHSGGDFMVISGDLKRQFAHKYLKDCARKLLGLSPLNRYQKPLLHQNHLN